jgi:DNA-binding MarR family transcriptional regulator
MFVSYNHYDRRIDGIMSIDPALVRRFHGEMVELIKKYQFRDRNEMVPSGMSVSQCYILETLHRFGPLPMQHLADKMHLSISTVTRVIAPLVAKQLVLREASPRDGRVRVATLTPKGSTLVIASWNSVLVSERSILESFPEDRREMLVELLHKLNLAFGNWKPRRSRT